LINNYHRLDFRTAQHCRSNKLGYCRLRNLKEFHGCLQLFTRKSRTQPYQYLQMAVRQEKSMEKMVISIEWEGTTGPWGPQDIQKMLESQYKSHFRVYRVNLETNEPPEKLVYSVSEASTLLGISKAAIYSLLYQKQIPGVQWGKRWLISKVAIEKQLGVTIEQKKKLLMNEIERASLVATAEEALKLYELLHGKLELLVKHLSDEK
jgi:excisionase family DNA binding protein